MYVLIEIEHALWEHAEKKNSCHFFVRVPFLGRYRSQIRRESSWFNIAAIPQN